MTRIAILDTGTPSAILGGGTQDMLETLQDDHPDRNGHATAVSSILYGGKGIVGLCASAYPMFIPVLDDAGVGTINSISKGIYEAIERKADLINLSVGFLRTKTCPKQLVKACEAAYEAGITIICAAGNDGQSVNWPAGLETTICVGSIGQNGTKSAFSSTGEVDFVAPGVDLPVLDLNGCIKTVSGTSFSTAIVSGMTALLISCLKKHQIYHQYVDRMQYALRSLAVDLDTPGKDSNTGYGGFGVFTPAKALQTRDATVDLVPHCGFWGKIMTKIKMMLNFA